MNDEPHSPLPANALQAKQWIADLRLQLQRQDILFRDPPEEPTSCCGRGCNGCVWEAYFHAVAYWCGQVRSLVRQPDLEPQDTRQPSANRNNA